MEVPGSGIRDPGSGLHVLDNMPTIQKAAQRDTDCFSQNYKIAFIFQIY
jgi:hypothetical protein